MIVGGGVTAAQIDNLEARTNAAIDAVEKLASRGTAIAMASMQSVLDLLAGESGVGIGVGAFNGQATLGASFVHSFGNAQL